MSDNAPLKTLEHETQSGLVVAHAELDVPSTLNSLSLEMTRLLDRALQTWREDERVCGVLITGAGDKAFCAGGDIQALYHAMGANHRAGQVVDDYPFRFFEEEYRLDYLIHTYPKPLITIGHGIVMGGGLGIFGASQFKVLTEKSRLAVPEITIGLFPDAGASWTLKKMPVHLAAFLGLTGSHANAADALHAGMGDYVVDHDARTRVVDGILGLSWGGDVDADTQMLDDYLSSIQTPPLPASELQNIPPWDIPLQGPSDLASLVSIVEHIYSLGGTSSWVDRGIGNLKNGCPTTAGIVVEQLHRVQDMALADTFRMELTVGTHCANNRDFHEGVRALLIDKDNQPDWSYGEIGALDWQHVMSHFEEPWADHPLADLGDA
ncbi:MAG: enoyl-CoA hydratase/isomerase family protein [Pseudomonadota bacterium]